MPRSRSLVPLLSMAVLAFVAASSGSAQLAQPPTGSGHGQKALTWTAPSEWTKEKPSSPLRRGQYRIPGPGGPAECTVFYFGPGQGGDAESNIERWISQFRRADGSPASNAAKKRQITVGAKRARTTCCSARSPRDLTPTGSSAPSGRVTRSSASARRLNDW